VVTKINNFEEQSHSPVFYKMNTLNDLFEIKRAVKNAPRFESQTLNTLKLLNFELYYIVVSLPKDVARCSSKISNLIDILARYIQK
jgi:hypothetical protein